MGLESILVGFWCLRTLMSRKLKKWMYVDYVNPSIRYQGKRINRRWNNKWSKIWSKRPWVGDLGRLFLNFTEFGGPQDGEFQYLSYHFENLFFSILNVNTRFHTHRTPIHFHQKNFFLENQTYLSMNGNYLWHNNCSIFLKNQFFQM